MFHPQHSAVPPAPTAHVSLIPAETALAVVSPASTQTGTVDEVVEPSPSRPDALSPQHFIIPPPTMAHVV